MDCRSGGIGRRARFRSVYSQGCGGSSPPFGTKPSNQDLSAAASAGCNACLGAARARERWRRLGAGRARGRSTHGGFAGGETRLQDDAAVVEWLRAGKNLENKLACAAADLTASLIDAGERNADYIVIMQVAASDHGQVARNGDVLAEGLGDDPDRDDVVDAEYSVRRAAKADQLPERGGPVLLTVYIDSRRLHDVFRRKPDAMLFQRIEEALEAAIADAVFRASYVGKASTAHSQQMLGCEFSSGVIVRTNKVGGQVFERAVQQEQGRVTLLGLAEGIRIRLARGDHQRIQAVRQHVLDLLLLQFGIFFGRRDHHEVSLLAKRERQALGHVGKKRMDEVGDDEADERGPSGNQGPRGEIGPVAELFDLQADALARRLADIRMVAKRL